MLKALGFLAIGLGIALFTGSRAQAQVSVSIGQPPVCPYGYYKDRLTTARQMATMGPEWLSGGVFFGVGPWFLGPEHMDTWIIISTIARATTGPCQRSRSTLVPSSRSFFE
jgi:hypothetical protein